MSLERKLQETIERNADVLRPGSDPLGRATARLRKAQRRRAAGAAIALVLVAAGSALAVTHIRGDDDGHVVTPAPSGSATPTGSTIPSSHEAIAVEFATKRIAAAVTEEGLALTLDAGATWRHLGLLKEWSGDLAFAGDNLVVAFEADRMISIARRPLADCTEPCSSVRFLQAGWPGRDGYQGLWLSFVNAEHGWLNVGISMSEIDSVAELYETTDGGATWKLVSKPRVGAITFTDDRTGFLSGGFAASSENDGLFRTTDAGKTWQEITPATPAGCNRNEAGQPLPHFFDSQNGIFLSSFACGGFEFNRSEIMVTADGGSTWSRRGSLKLPHPEDSGVLAVADPTTLVVTNGKSILESTDGGRTFKTSVAEVDVMVFGLSFLNPSFGWATVVRGDCATKTCSDPPRLYVTFDRGRSLRAIDVFY
jgi:hypothetical protein